MFRLQEASLKHRAVAVEHLFAPAAELLLDATKGLDSSAVVLCLEPGAAVLAGAARKHPATHEARIIGLERTPEALRVSQQLFGGHWLRADAWFLPLASASVDAALVNLVLGDAEMDRPLLRELVRVLKPGGQLLASTLLAGTLEEFFDVTQEVCEQQGLVESRAVLADERSVAYDAGRLRSVLEKAGFAEVKVGQENRAAPFEDGHQFVDDPVVQNVFLVDWLRSLGSARVRAAALAAIAEAINTYFFGIGFTARLVTGVATARKP